MGADEGANSTPPPPPNSASLHIFQAIFTPPSSTFPHSTQAKTLKEPFELEVLTVLGQASSHHELWLDLHYSTANAGTITANLKGKARAREKIVLEYNGDLRWETSAQNIQLPCLFMIFFGAALFCF